MDLKEYKLPWLGFKHVQAIKYADFVKTLRQANPDKDVNRDIVEACFWKAINVQIWDHKVKGTKAAAMIAEGRKVLAQARKYWT